MPVFEYRAVGANGAITQGSLDANGRGDAMRVIEERGLTPLRVTESGTQTKSANPSSGAKLPASWKLNFQSKKVPFAALEDFTRSLASLLTASVPLSRALTILYKECSNQAAAEKWKELHDLVVD